MAGDLHRISIHALLAESDLGLLKQAGFSILISIHALLAESDCEWADYPTKVLEISIHALLAESDTSTRFFRGGGVKFQSTLSLRRATPNKPGHYLSAGFQSTLSLRRATVSDAGNWIITDEGFQSTLSLRRATTIRRSNTVGPYISIHALLAESDQEDPDLVTRPFRFQSTLSLRRAT